MYEISRCLRDRHCHLSLNQIIHIIFTFMLTVKTHVIYTTPPNIQFPISYNRNSQGIDIVNNNELTLKNFNHIMTLTSVLNVLTQIIPGITAYHDTSEKVYINISTECLKHRLSLVSQLTMILVIKSASTSVLNVLTQIIPGITACPI